MEDNKKYVLPPLKKSFSCLQITNTNNLIYSQNSETKYNISPHDNTCSYEISSSENELSKQIPSSKNGKNNFFPLNQSYLNKEANYKNIRYQNIANNEKFSYLYEKNKPINLFKPNLTPKKNSYELKPIFVENFSKMAVNLKSKILEKADAIK